MLYIFGLFWLVRRPNLLIVVGGILSICLLILTVVLLISLFGHQPPLAVGSTVSKLNIYFALKTAFSLLAQLGCGAIAFFNLYLFPRAFQHANAYMFQAMEDDSSSAASDGSYVPPSLMKRVDVGEEDTFSDHSSVRLHTLHEDAAEHTQNLLSVLSNSRDTQSM